MKKLPHEESGLAKFLKNPYAYYKEPRARPEISILSQEERLKQCSKCKGDSEMKKYVLTDKGRALTQRPSIFYGTLWPNLTDGSSFMSPDEGEKSPECKIQSKIGTPKIGTFF